MLNHRELKTIYNNEQILLILISRLYFNTCEHGAVAEFILQENIRWQIVYKTAALHGIRSFIYSVIDKHHLPVGDEFMANLKKSYAATKLKNFTQIKTATALASEFKNKGITLIPYKGAFFAINYYSDWGARESVDIDFLVDKKDVKTIEDYFKANNFKAITTVPRGYLSYYQLFFKDLVYVDPNIKAGVEIHWRLMDRFSGNFPSCRFFLPHLEPYTTGSFTIDKLSSTYDFLAMTSNHFVKDLSIKLKFLIDAACIITGQKDVLDAGVIKACAKEFEFEKRLNLGLGLVNEILGVHFLVLENERPSDEMLKMPLADKLPRLYIDEREFINHSLKLQDHFFGKIKFLLRCGLYYLLPTYTDINEFRLPKYGLPLLFVIRPFRIFIRRLRK